MEANNDIQSFHFPLVKMQQISEFYPLVSFLYLYSDDVILKNMSYVDIKETTAKRVKNTSCHKV